MFQTEQCHARHVCWLTRMCVFAHWKLQQWRIHYTLAIYLWSTRFIGVTTLAIINGEIPSNLSYLPCTCTCILLFLEIVWLFFTSVFLSSWLPMCERHVHSTFPCVRRRGQDKILQSAKSPLFLTLKKTTFIDPIWVFHETIRWNVVLTRNTH